MIFTFILDKRSRITKVRALLQFPGLLQPEIILAEKHAFYII